MEGRLGLHMVSFRNQGPISIVGGRAHPQAGFTLLELLVALGILALAMGVALPSLRSANQTARIEPLTAQITADLKRARTAAMAGNRPVALAIDPALHGYTIPAISYQAKLPAAASLSLTTPRGGQKASQAGQVTFFPDGSSTGGQLTIANRSGESMTLSIEWLTGAVHVLGRQR